MKLRTIAGPSRPRRAAAAAALIIAVALAGCATSTPPAEVTRFHLGQPIPSDTLFLEAPAGVDAGSLEFRNHAEAVAKALDGVGLHPAATAAGAAYIGVLKVEQTVRAGVPKPSPFHIGIGGASFGGGVGVGGGVSVPVGKARPNDIHVNQLSLQIRRHSDNSVVWEGRASQQIAADAPAASLTAAVPVLARAMLSDFPGPNGQTVQVKTKP